MTENTSPPFLAVDANGCVWRVYENHWSMAPTNPDNEPVPGPITYYAPIGTRRRADNAREIDVAHRNARKYSDDLMRAILSNESNAR